MVNWDDAMLQRVEAVLCSAADRLRAVQRARLDVGRDIVTDADLTAERIPKYPPSPATLLGCIRVSVPA